MYVCVYVCVFVYIPAASMDDNELLKSKFHRVHAELARQNLSSAVDRLSSAGVISSADMEELFSATAGQCDLYFVIAKTNTKKSETHTTSQ